MRAGTADLPGRSPSPPSSRRWRACGGWPAWRARSPAV